MKAMFLIIFALFILVAGGVIYNNFSNSGMSTPQPVSSCNGYVCPAFPALNPCAVYTNCSLQTVSFLNPNSPFSYIFAGDISGFLSSFTNAPQSQGLNALSVCITPQTGTGFTFLHCTASSWSIAGPPIQQYPIVSCNLGGQYGTGFNATAASSPYTTTSGQANTTTWTIQGCAPLSKQNTNPSTNYAFLQILGDYSGKNGSIALTRYNPGLADVLSSSGNGINIGTFFGFVSGIILFVMSFGIGFAAGAFSNSFQFSSNEAGTRLAQTLGLGLLIWSPMFSEFGTWFNVFTLGLSTIVSLLITIVFFFGIYWQILSWN